MRMLVIFWILVENHSTFITMIKHFWRSSTAEENHIGHCLHWLALPVYAFKDHGPGLVWNSKTQEMVEPNADKRERAMGFPTCTTHVLGISEQQRRFLLDQAMDLNYLTWIMSLVVAE